jgi:hypothetical protein
MTRKDITTLDIIRNILIAEVFIDGGHIDEKRVNIYNQKFEMPTDDNLFITLSTDGQKVKSNPQANTEVSTETETLDQYIETIKVLMQEPVTISLLSRNEDALKAIPDVIAAMASTYAQQVQEKCSIKIARLPAEPVKNLSSVEATARLFRFDITFNVDTWYKIQKNVDYYDTFLAKLAVAQGTKVEYRGINSTVEDGEVDPDEL